MSFLNGVSPQSVASAPDGYQQFKIGDNNARISKVVEGQSKKGDPMLEITFTNEEGATIRYYIVDGEYKLSKLKQLCLAFNIPFADVSYYQRWLHKWGVVVCKEGKPYNGNVYPEVSYVRPAESRQQSRPQAQPQGQQQAYSQPQQPYHPPAEQPPQHADDAFTDDIPF